MNLKERQSHGLMLLLPIALVIYAVGAAWQWHRHADVDIPWSNIHSGPIIVAITGKTDHNGIYYLPESISLHELFVMAGMEHEYPFFSHHDETLKTGTTIHIEDNKQLVLEDMKGAMRLALHLPININRANGDEILMVPGVGENTARQIMELRRSSGGKIDQLEDLLTINGIKEKRLERLRRFIYVAE